MVRVAGAVVDMDLTVLARVTSPAVNRSLIVVGAGVFGASLTRHCARVGWDVLLVERVSPGHVRAGSGDESRIIRCGHGSGGGRPGAPRPPRGGRGRSRPG